MIRSKQSHLLLGKELHSKDVQLVLDSLLQTKGIYIPTIVGITASFYTKLNDWSGDTLSMRTNFKSTFAKQGIFEDIDYHVYAGIPFASAWKLMPHALILSLFSATLLTGILIGYILVSLENTPTIKNNMLIIGPNETKIQPQMKALLEMFLSAEDYQVCKEDIVKEFWPKNTKPTTNITTAIDRLNKTLLEVSNRWMVVTDTMNESCYTLVRKEKPMFKFSSFQKRCDTNVTPKD